METLCTALLSPSEISCGHLRLTPQSGAQQDLVPGSRPMLLAPTFKGRQMKTVYGQISQGKTATFALTLYKTAIQSIYIPHINVRYHSTFVITMR